MYSNDWKDDCKIQWEDREASISSIKEREFEPWIDKIDIRIKTFSNKG